MTIEEVVSRVAQRICHDTEDAAETCDNHKNQVRSVLHTIRLSELHILVGWHEDQR